MEELKALESMGLVLPSAWYIVGAILFGIVGYVFFRCGQATFIRLVHAFNMKWSLLNEYVTKLPLRSCFLSTAKLS